MWPLGAGGINYHFVYWPAYLNIKVLPLWFKEECAKKYEEFILYWIEHWELSIPEHLKGKITKEDWLTASYGIKRLRGMINFMKSEDWSNRLVETQEYLESLDKLRGMSFYETFPHMKDIFK
jgi:hypothetical protein